MERVPGWTLEEGLERLAPFFDYAPVIRKSSVANGRFSCHQSVSRKLCINRTHSFIRR